MSGFGKQSGNNRLQPDFSWIRTPSEIFFFEQHFFKEQNVTKNNIYIWDSLNSMFESAN